jgi:hypothetical protein
MPLYRVDAVTYQNPFLVKENGEHFFFRVSRGSVLYSTANTMIFFSLSTLNLAALARASTTYVFLTFGLALASALAKTLLFGKAVKLTVRRRDLIADGYLYAFEWFWFFVCVSTASLCAAVVETPYFVMLATISTVFAIGSFVPMVILAYRNLSKNVAA